MENRYEDALKALGMEIVNKNQVGQIEIVYAQIQTNKGSLEVTCGSNGNAMFCKPNGSKKMVYGKSYAMIHRIAQQIIDANK